MAVLVRAGAFPSGDVQLQDFVGISVRLRTRGQMLALLDEVNENELTTEQTAAATFLRAYLDDPANDSARPNWASTSGLAGVVTGEAGGRSDSGRKRKGYADALGALRVYGTAAGDVYYAVGASNFYSQRDVYTSVTTRNGGLGPSNDVRALSGFQDAYVALGGPRGLRFKIGQVSRRWGPGYSGDMLVGDGAPAHPGLEIEFPFYLGRTFGSWRFTQFQEAYTSVGKYVYYGGRRLIHPFNDRLELDIQESYEAKKIRNELIQVLPYYAYQRIFIHNNGIEPTEFDYNVYGGLTYRPNGPTGNSLGYLEFFIDDIKAPKGLGQPGRVPRKIAYLLGYNRFFPSAGMDGVVEYGHSDPTSYTKTDPTFAPLAPFVNGLPTSSPIGPNGNELYVRLSKRLGSRLEAVVEGAHRVRVHDDYPAPAYSLLGGAVGYLVRPGQILAVRYAQYNEDPYTGNPGTPAPAIEGGADYGQHVRQRVAAVDYSVAF